MEHMDSCIKIGQKAPDFKCMSTFGPVQLSDYKGKWLIFFSHPSDFTPVCTTEFIAFTEAYPKFAAKNACLLGLSIDSNPSHLAWVNDIYKATGTQIPFPILADRTGDIAKTYGMLPENPQTFATVRNTYIICPNQIVRSILVYPYTNGRNIPEILRLLEALQTSYEEDVVTPANWLPGSPVIVPPPQTYEQLREREMNHKNLDCKTWYLCYKK